MSKIEEEGLISHTVNIQSKLVTFRDNFMRGDQSYLIEAIQKLRVFYLDKGGKSLLTQLEERFNFTFMAYHTANMIDQFRKEEDIETADSILNGTLYYFHESHVSWLNNGEEFIPLKEVIKRNVFIMTGTFYSVEKMISIMADKMGGSHIDENISGNHTKLFSEIAMFGNRNQTEQLLLSVINTTILIITIILFYRFSGVLSHFIKRNNLQYPI